MNLPFDNMTTTTPIRWKELSARERDALIQERVFAKCTHGTPADWHYEGPEGDLELVCKLCSQSPDISKYSTDLSAAFQVVEKMRERGFAFVLESPNPILSCPKSLLWVASFRRTQAYGETAPEAIAVCALTAIGVTIERE